ncbi:MAG: alpha/beta hydrolase [Saprospiraceae bacterium]|nr:alpha/beta hydrolase [Saprospiraceae bacterium]
MKHISWNNQEIAYSIEGKGNVVVLLHGFCGDSFIWKDFKHDLLEENFKVICIDLPGFGGSSLMSEPSIEKMADAVHAVLTEVNSKDFVLFGHSMGGYVSLSYLEKYPERLRGIGLIHSHPFGDQPEKQKARDKGIDFIKKYGHQLYVKQLIPTLFAPKVVASNPFLVDKLVFRASKYQPQGIIDALTAMKNRPDRSHVLENAEVPVFFLIGEKDQTIPTELSLEQTHLPKLASIHIMPKVAHMAMFENEKQCQIQIRKFADYCFSDQLTLSS